MENHGNVHDRRLSPPGILGVPTRLLASRFLIWLLGVPLLLVAFFAPMEVSLRIASFSMGITLIAIGIYVGASVPSKHTKLGI
jgi:bacteriorhodopsin